MKVIATCCAFLLATAPAVSACEPAWEEPASFDPSTAYEGEPKPTAPVARVDRIQRGTRSSSRDLCGDIAFVQIAVRDDSPRLPYLFEFKQVSGTAPDLIFQGGLLAGESNGKGEYLFSFYWPDLARTTPVDLKVRITPHTRSGIKGPSVVIPLSDRGI